MKLAHRDIKPENILLTNEDRLLFKVCDVIDIFKHNYRLVLVHTQLMKLQQSELLEELFHINLLKYS